VTWAAVLAGPHPLLGGQRENNVVQALQLTFARQGAAALSFDYSLGDEVADESTWLASVSRFWEQGSAPAEDRWVEDADGAMAVLGGLGTAPTVLVGYSFGCWVVAQTTSLAHSRAVVLIAPNPRQHCFRRLEGFPIHRLVVHPDQDLACPTERLVAWFDGLRGPKTRLRFPAGEHFFRGCESDLASAVVCFLQRSRIIPGSSA
jgi:alpha/beta superfamily hydrolase